MARYQYYIPGRGRRWKLRWAFGLSPIQRYDRVVVDAGIILVFCHEKPYTNDILYQPREDLPTELIFEDLEWPIKST
ncbi:hypothetical protein LCGC14_2525440 [marine sediment metagenome]|uniref:Uncharacterized protein n=1 Tax=marine sediment metagenome TaxID=412755 RepID=A0A0F9DND5_9ZZZZ